MKIKSFLMIILLISLSVLQTGMGRKGEYDEEAREAERQAKLQGKTAESMPKKVERVEGSEEVLEETTDDGTFTRTSRTTKKVLDKTVKGTVKVATLGYGNADNYEVQQPESGKDEPTKFKIKL
jgi:hypothetical protein